MLTRIFCSIFFVLLVIPSVSYIVTPGFRSYIGAVINKDQSDIALKKEALIRKNKLRTGLVSVHNTALYKIGVSAVPQAAEVGRNGWIYLGNMQANNFDQATHRSTLSDTDAESYANKLKSIQAWLGAKQTPFYFVAAPMKASIYPEELPAWASITRDRHPLSSFDKVKKYTSTPLPFIDVRQALIDEKKNGQVYSKLNTHWTELGAFYAWNEILRVIKNDQPRLGDKLPSLTIKSRSLIDGLNEYDGLANIHAENNWERYELNEPSPLVETQNPDQTWSPPHTITAVGLLDFPRVIRNKNAPNKLKLLVLSDSMGTGLSPLMQRFFYEVIYENHHVPLWGKPFNIKKLYEKYKPDLVIYVMTERYFFLPFNVTFTD